MTRFSSRGDLAQGSVQSRNYATNPVSKNPLSETNVPSAKFKHTEAEKKTLDKDPEIVSISPTKSILKNGANSTRFRAPLQERSDINHALADTKLAEQLNPNKT